MALKRHEMICGCYVTKDGIQFCHMHSIARDMAGVLAMICGYYIETMKERAGESPFVQRIDALLPR